jgi:hypothetical protein
LRKTNVFQCRLVFLQKPDLPFVRSERCLSNRFCFRKPKAVSQGFSHATAQRRHGKGRVLWKKQFTAHGSKLIAERMEEGRLPAFSGRIRHRSASFLRFSGKVVAFCGHEAASRNAATTPRERLAFLSCRTKGAAN